MVIKKVMDDLKFWVSVVMELYIMCIDVFLEVSFEDGKWIEQDLVYIQEFLSNVLVFINVLVIYGDKIQNWKLMGFSIFSGINILDLIGVEILLVFGFCNWRFLFIIDSFFGWMDVQMKCYFL